MSETKHDSVTNLPLYNAARKYAESGTLPFHMPGHKLGRGIPEEYLQNLAELDLTEIPGTDNLHHPTAAIMEAQRLAAAAFGARRTYFLVNGSTCGIQAAVSTLCRRGDTLIVNRDCHKSVIGAMMLAGVKPVYVMPGYADDFGINTGVHPREIKEAFDSNPEAAGVFITSPNYYGICSDIGGISSIVHAHGKLLVVDEAHGAHLKFNRRLPVCAMDAGADISVQSAHKTLPAFTQGAYLHVGTESVDIGRLESYLRLFQTSSPSYIIMALLDIARHLMQHNGKEQLDLLIDSLHSYKAAYPLKNIEILDSKATGGYAQDETRLVACFRRLGMTGYEAASILRESYGIQVEMQDFSNIVCITAPSDIDASLGKLFLSLKALDDRHEGRSPLKLPGFRPLKPPEQEAELSEVLNAPKVKVKLDKASGRISGGIVAPYPPGIPVLCPGERISPEAVDILKNVIDMGGAVDGVDDDMHIDVI